MLSWKTHLLSAPLSFCVGPNRKLSLCTRGGKRGHAHSWMKSSNPSTSAKPVMTKLQNVFVALVNMDTFQMTQKLSLFTADF